MDHEEICAKVNESYGLMKRSEDVASAVFDFCNTQHVTVTYGSFRAACQDLADLRGVMHPTSKVMRFLHSQLKPVKLDVMPGEMYQNERGVVYKAFRDARGRMYFARLDEDGVGVTAIPASSTIFTIKKFSA